MKASAPTSRHPVGRGEVDPKKLPQGENGRAMCRCGCGREVGLRRQTFFSNECVKQWKEANPFQGELRHLAWKRDRGICALCARHCQDSPFRWERLYPWQADHIIPLVEGGAHNLSNIRTLCQDCHRRETAALRARLASKTVVEAKP